MVVQRERTIRRFSGSPDQQVADWVEEARACLGVHGLDGAAAANFVLSNLEGAARIEIKCRPAGEHEDVDKLFRALEEVYGETLTSSQLLRQFYERHQGERESMSDFSHALVLLLDRLHSVDSTAVRNKDRMLREQFLENGLEAESRTGSRDDFLSRAQSGYVLGERSRERACSEDASPHFSTRSSN